MLYRLVHKCLNASIEYSCIKFIKCAYLWCVFSCKTSPTSMSSKIEHQCSHLIYIITRNWYKLLFFVNSNYCTPYLATTMTTYASNILTTTIYTSAHLLRFAAIILDKLVQYRKRNHDKYTNETVRIHVSGDYHQPCLMIEKLKEVK